MKQAKRQSLRRYADQLWSKRIRERDKVCQMKSDECWGNLQAAHFYRRGIFSTRWNLDNGAALCALHHRAFDTDELDKWSWISARLGEDRLQALQAAQKEPWDKDYRVVIGELKNGGVLRNEIT